MILDDLFASIKHLSRRVLDVAYCELDFRGQLNWQPSLEDALYVAKKEKKPVMVVVYKDGCPACAKLLPKMANCSTVANYTRDIAVVSVSEENAGPELQIDGAYVPRILFMSPSGEVQTKFYNKYGSDSWKYFYQNNDTLIVTLLDIQNEYPSRCEPGKPCFFHGKHEQ